MAVGTSYSTNTSVAVPHTLAERWNGTTWTVEHTRMPTGAFGGSLAGVSCVSRSACTAVGYYFNRTQTFALAERWNGTKWAMQRTPMPTGTKNSTFVGVACASKSACIALGSYRKHGAEVTLAEGWNGTKWAIERTPMPTGAKHGSLAGVSCVSARACIATGSYYNGTRYLTLSERWNGTKWAIEHTPNPKGVTDSYLGGVSCASANACSAVGESDTGAGPSATAATLAERWNGTKWTIEPTQNPTSAQQSELGGVSCFSRSACAAVGYYDDGHTPIFTLAESRNGG